jgi:hypothetical protein
MELRNLLHFHTWNLSTPFVLSVFNNIPTSFFCLQKSSTINSRNSKLWNQKFCCKCYLFEASNENAPENLICNTNLNQQFSGTRQQDFIPARQKVGFLYRDPLGLRLIATFATTHACEQFLSLTNNDRIKRRSRLTDNTWNLSWQWFPVIYQRWYKSSAGANDAKFPANLHSKWRQMSQLYSLANL